MQRGKAWMMQTEHGSVRPVLTRHHLQPSVNPKTESELLVECTLKSVNDSHSSSPKTPNHKLTTEKFKLRLNA